MEVEQSGVSAGHPLTMGIVDAAALLLVHHTTLRTLAITGKVPGRRVGRRWVFVTEDLLAYIREGGPVQQRARGQAETRALEAQQMQASNARYLQILGINPDGTRMQPPKRTR